MPEWIWLLVGMFWGVWINYSDASYYKQIVKVQERYINLLLNKLDDENG